MAGPAPLGAPRWWAPLSGLLCVAVAIAACVEAAPDPQLPPTQCDADGRYRRASNEQLIDRYCDEYVRCELYRLASYDGARQAERWNFWLTVLQGLFAALIVAMGTLAATHREIDADDEECLEIEDPKQRARERRRRRNARNQRRRRLAYVTVALALASGLTITLNNALGPSRTRDDYRSIPQQMYELEQAAGKLIGEFHAEMARSVPDERLAASYLQQAQATLKACQIKAGSLAWAPEIEIAYAAVTGVRGGRDAGVADAADAADAAPDAFSFTRGDAGSHGGAVVLDEEYASDTVVRAGVIRIPAGAHIRIRNGATLELIGTLVVEGPAEIDGTGEPGRRGDPGRSVREPWSSRGDDDYAAATAACDRDPTHPDRGQAGGPGGAGGPGATLVVPRSADLSRLQIVLRGGAGGAGGAGGSGRLLRNGRNFYCDGCMHACPAGPDGAPGATGPEGRVLRR